MVGAAVQIVKIVETSKVSRGVRPFVSGLPAFGSCVMMSLPSLAVQILSYCF